MAARILREKGVDAQTIHRFSGISDGRFTTDELVTNIAAGEHCGVDNIRHLDCLVIDEISMLSAKLFSQIELVCRKVKGNDKLFGGVQIILCGDFQQLKPVPNPRYGDEGQFVFSSDAFHGIPHHVTLQKVHRQEQPDLIAAVKELAR